MLRVVKVAPAPKDTQVLARDLGINAKRLRGMTETHGDRLTVVLQRMWRKHCREHPRFLGAGPVAADEKERGRLGEDEEHGYTGTTYLAVDKVECVDEAEQGRQSKEGQEKWRLYMQTHRPNEYLGMELRRKTERVRRLKSEALRRGVDVRAEYDTFITHLEAKLRSEAA